MATATLEAAPHKERPGRGPRRSLGKRLLHLNWLGGLAGWIWLFIIIAPIYWIIITSLKSQTNYFSSNAMVPTSNPTLDNFRLVLDSGFSHYFVNSAIVTLGAVIPAVLVSFMASYAIIRDGRRWFIRGANWLFLTGLAIPLQAAIIPIYLEIIKMGLYDSLLAMVLPSIAFAIPLSVLVLTNFIRDVPRELFESMRVDGASEWQLLWRLAFPLTRPALVTVTIYQAVLIWNNFLLPLVLTQSPDKRTLPLALWTFQGQYAVNVPAVLASVLLTVLPIFVLYVVGRRQLVSGLSGGISK